MLARDIALCHNARVHTMARRRRRKSTSARRHKSTTGNAGRKWLTGLAIALIILILTPIIGSYQLLNWLQGEGFRARLSEKLANRAQADEVNIPHPLHIDDGRVSLPAIELRRCDMLQQATAERIVADIDRDRLISRELLIKKLTMEEATLRLDSDADGTLPPVLEEDNGLLSRLTPRTFKLQAFECTDADVELLLSEKLYSLTGCRVSAEPLSKTGNDEWQINIENGRVHTPLSYLSNCSVKSATLLSSKKAIALSECRFMLTPGELKLKGNYNRNNKQWHLDLRANKANVERLLNNDWKKHLSGELYGTLKINGQAKAIKKAAGNIALQQAVIEGLPILSDLTIDNTRPYRTISLEKAECRVSYPYSRPGHNISDAWLFDNIDIRSTEGTLLVKGHVIICPGGALHGTLTIGLPETTVEQLTSLAPDISAQLFNASGAPGYRWLNINLSGTVDAPQEDLSARLRTILAATLPQAAAEAAGSAARTAGELLNSLLSPAPAPPEPTDSPTSEQPDSPGLIPTATDVLDIIF